MFILDSSAGHFSASGSHGTKHRHMSTINPTMGVVPTKSAEASRYTQHYNVCALNGVNLALTMGFSVL